MPTSPRPSLSSTSSGGVSSYIGKNGEVDPITRTALRYSISPREYQLLHQYLISRAPARVSKKAPDPEAFKKIVKPDASPKDGGEGEEFRADSFRLALRVFGVAYLGFKGFSVLMESLARRRQQVVAETAAPAPAKARHPNFRYALSLSSILFFNRILHRFMTQLRSSLLLPSSEAFRKRNPRIAALLTSSYAPALGAGLSGLFLGIAPTDQLRMTIAIYVLSRGLEWAYDAAASSGYIWKLDEEGKPQRPSWFGSWMLMPFIFGQLLHAVVFDRECFPDSFGNFVLARSPEYIQARPEGYPASSPWPEQYDIVDALAELSKSRWIPFTSPILFPNLKATLPPALSKVSPITGPAHPLIKHTSCAVMHPKDPSCTHVYFKYWTQAFPAAVKFFTIMYGGFALLGFRQLRKAPIPALNALSARILRISLFVTGAIGTSWGSICLFNNTLPKNFLPTQRWFLGGFIGGLWAYIARHKERSNFIYCLRLSIESTWKVGVKRGLWKGVRGGDVLVFAASLAVIDAVYQSRPEAIEGAAFRKGLGVLRGDGWVDRAEKPASSSAPKEVNDASDQAETAVETKKDE